MTDRPETDAEVIAALDAFMPLWRSQNRRPMWKSISLMRAALDAAAAHRPVAEHADLQLATVTKERDDARAGRKILSRGSWDISVMFMECQKERDALKSQLAARDAEVARLREAYSAGLRAVAAHEDALADATEDAREKEEG